MKWVKKKLVMKKNKLKGLDVSHGISTVTRNYFHPVVKK
jgi:hypothetical protein